jgi:capsular exopolysaccharide synthesis family protein
MAPYAGVPWQTGPAPRPEMLSAAPDPMSMLRAFRRRWPLATGLGILAALAAMAGAWYVIPQKGEVIAYVQVMRDPETMTTKARQADSYEFLTYRNTTVEMMKSKSLLTRAIRDPSIAQLPLIKKQNDPVEWLQDQLSMKYPGDAELLQVTMSGSIEEIDNIVNIVNAVINAYFKEVVEKGVLERTKKEQKLSELRQMKSEELLRDMKDIEGLQKNLGIVDPAAAAAQNQMLQQQLGVVNNSIFSHTSQAANLEVEVDKLKLDIELARDPAAREARAEEEMHKDDKLKKLEEQKSDLELAISEAKNQVKGKDNPTVKRLAKSLQAVEEKVGLRRDDLMKRFSDSNESVKIKEFEGKKLATEKHRASVVEQIAELKEQHTELTEKLTVMTRDTAELDTKRQRVKTLQALVDGLNADLYKISVEKSAPSRVQKLDDAIAPGGSSMKRKAGLVGFAGFAVFAMVGLAVAFFEFQARRISTSSQLSDGLGLRVVGALPSVTRPGRKALAAANGDLNRLLVESIDTVRTNLIHSAVSEPMRVVMITSALDREGKTTVASQLAASLARCGRRTLLVDGDLRRPTAHKLFELPLEPGLCEVLRGEGEVDDVIRPTRVAGLWMISAGQYDLESIQALSKDGVGDIFDVLRSRFDFIIVDSAPVLSIADASMMGQNVDAAILCVMREVSQASKVYEASEQLRSVGIHVLGAVINGERTEATYRAHAARA